MVETAECDGEHVVDILVLLQLLDLPLQLAQGRPVGIEPEDCRGGAAIVQLLGCKALHSTSLTGLLRLFARKVVAEAGSTNKQESALSRTTGAARHICRTRCDTFV